MPRERRRPNDRTSGSDAAACVDRSLTFGRRSFVMVMLAALVPSGLGRPAAGADLGADEVRALLAAHAGPAVPDLSNRNLAGLDLAGLDFKGANLTGANLKKANLAGADLS